MFLTRRNLLTRSGLAIGGTMTGCARRRSGTLAVIPKTTAIDYWDNLRAGAHGAAAKLGFRIFWNAPPSESDYAQQALMVEDVIRRKVDGIVLAPSHGSVLASAVRHARAENIPLVVVDSPVMVEPSEYAAYIGSDARQMGELAATRMGKVLGGRGEAAILGISPTVEAGVQRERAFAGAIASQFPGMRIVGVQFCLSDVARARQIASDLLAARPGVQALFASDQFATRGAFITLRALKSRSVRLVGVAQERDLLFYLERGQIDSLVVQDPYSMGRRAVEILGRLLVSRDDGPRRIETRAAIATRENVTTPEIQDLVALRSL